jgi:hypothetical protein
MSILLAQMIPMAWTNKWRRSSLWFSNELITLTFKLDAGQDLRMILLGQYNTLWDSSELITHIFKNHKYFGSLSLYLDSNMRSTHFEILF